MHLWLARGRIRDMSRPRSKSVYPKAFEALYKARGYANPHQVARAAGHPDLLRDILRKGTVPGADKLEAFARVLGVSMEELSVILDLPRRPVNIPPALDAPRPRPLLPVRFAVQAGAWLETGADAGDGPDENAPVVAHNAYPAQAQFLARVLGDSMDLLFPEGGWAHCAAAREIGYDQPKEGDIVVVERVRQQDALIERSLKQVSVGRRKIELWPRSRNAQWKSPIEFPSEDANTTVEIVALVIGRYLPTRR